MQIEINDPKNITSEKYKHTEGAKYELINVENFSNIVL